MDTGSDEMKIDAVFEGGGVKGIGLVGAVEITERKGYQFNNLAGTSAGAIVASLLAAGYTGQELKQILQALDYNNFKDKGLLDQIPLLGPALSLGFEKGIYEGDFLEEWLRDLLAKKGVSKFGDLIMKGYDRSSKYYYKLQVVASDITRGRMLVLPKDIVDFNIDPDELDVAQAVRMSMSIPFFFEPVILTDKDGNKCHIVDGGILSNYPIWLLDDNETQEPAWPTFGYKLVEPNANKPHVIKGAISMFAAMFTTMMDAHDARYIEDRDFVRSITIPTLDVKTTEFNITQERSEALYQSGVKAAEKFFRYWNFEQYKRNYRQQTPQKRIEQVWSVAPARTAIEPAGSF